MPYVTVPEVIPFVLVSACAMEADAVLLAAEDPDTLLGVTDHEYRVPETPLGFDNAMLVDCPEQREAELLVTDNVGVGLTVTVALVVPLLQPLALAVIPYVMVPDVLPLALVSAWVMACAEVLVTAEAPFTLLGETDQE